MAKSKELSFEDELKKLEAIVETLEAGNVPLATLVERYEAGVRHLKNCQQKLAEAELRIEQLRGVDADGNAIAEAFDDSENA